MNYLTNYYKHRCEILQEKVNYLNYLLENVQSTMAPELDATMVQSPPQSQPPTQKPPTQTPPSSKPRERAPGKPHPTNKDGRPGDGLAPGFNDKWKPDSKEWREWIQQNGHYHQNNPYPFGSEQWFAWEYEYYKYPPGP
jgi:hypothetical protein